MILNQFTCLLVINSFFILGLIFNQNESTKDTSVNVRAELSNPLENITWFCVSLEFLLFLIKSKITEI